MSRHVEKLEKNVEESRERLAMTLNELRSRMHVSSLQHEGAEYLRETAAGRFLTNLKADALGNPMPLALLGVAIAWLASTDRNTQRSASQGKYALVWRWRARRLSQFAQQNASRAVSTAQAAKFAAGELQQHAVEASTNLADQLSRAPSQARDMGQSLVKSTSARVSAVGNVTRTHPLLVGTAAAGLAAGAVGLALLYRRYTGELDAASRLVEASEEEAQTRAITAVPEVDATLVPQEFPNALEDLPVTTGQ